MKTLSKYAIPILIVLVILFFCLWLNGCGKAGKAVDEKTWKDSIATLHKERKLELDTLNSVYTDKIKQLTYANDSLQRLNDKDEPNISVSYAEIPKMDSIINSYSVDELNRELTRIFGK